MRDINFLLIDDEPEQEAIFKEAIDEINAENTSNNLTYKAVKTPEEAMIELYKNYFQAIIMDLKLTNDDNISTDDEQISGNILLNQIIQKEIIPIVVRTGFPSKVSDNINKSIVKVLSPLAK